MTHEIAERERRITHLAFNDVLTGLANRTMFHEHLNYQLRAKSGGKDAVRPVLPRSRPVQVDQRHVGPFAGRRAAARGRKAVERGRRRMLRRAPRRRRVRRRPAAAGDRGEIDRLAAAILEAIEQPFDVDGHHILPSTSIGIAIAPDDGDDLDTLLRNADLALYRAKGEGRGIYSFFEESLNEKAQARRVIESDLRGGDRARRVRALLPAPVRPQAEPHRLVRSPAALEPPDARAGRAARVHPDRRRYRADRSDRRVGDARSVPPGIGMARSHPRRGQCLAGPVPAPRAQPGDHQRAGAQRPGAEPAGDRDHRIDLPRRQRGNA